MKHFSGGNLTETRNCFKYKAAKKVLYCNQLRPKDCFNKQ